jgi:hypothetical protein
MIHPLFQNRKQCCSIVRNIAESFLKEKEKLKLFGLLKFILKFFMVVAYRATRALYVKLVSVTIKLCK